MTIQPNHAREAAERIAKHYAANDSERHANAMVPIIQAAIDATTAD